MDNVQIREYGGGAAGVGDNGVAMEMYEGQGTKPLKANRNVQCTMDNVQIREYGGGAAGEGANRAANGNVQISELGACGAALFLFSPGLGVGEAENGDGLSRLRFRCLSRLLSRRRQSRRRMSVLRGKVRWGGYCV